MRHRMPSTHWSSWTDQGNPAVQANSNCGVVSWVDKRLIDLGRIPLTHRCWWWLRCDSWEMKCLADTEMCWNSDGSLATYGPSLTLTHMCLPFPLPCPFHRSTFNVSLGNNTWAGHPSEQNACVWVPCAPLTPSLWTPFMQSQCNWTCCFSSKPLWHLISVEFSSL